MADSLRVSLAERDVEQAIASLKKGSYLLKYGRRGKPKFCPFKLSSDESAIVWYSGKEEKQIKLSQVMRIVPGQRTATFKRYPRPEKEYQSFSLICPDRSLDLICKDKDEAEIWVVGLKALITRFKVTKWKSTIKPEITSAECPSPTPNARRVSPFVTVLDQVIQPSTETSTQNRLGKAFSDIVSLTAPPSNSQTEANANLFCPFPPLNVDTSNSRFSISEAARISLSSAVSTSSHGSWHEDFDALGDVFLWGEAIRDGVLSTNAKSMNPTEDALLPKVLESTIVLDAQNIACGRCHAVLVTKQGEIFSWGEGTGGKLGHGLEKDVQHPKFISSVRGMGFKSSACGEFHTCAVTQSGDLYSWGDGTQNIDLLGHGSESSCWIPKRVTGVLQGVDVSHVACGPWHTAVVASSGQLFTFGDGTFGALGHGDRISTSVPREVESLSGVRVTKVACGVWHTAAVVEVTNEESDADLCSSSGQLYTWGDGEKGQLGHGDHYAKLVPECVISLMNEDIYRVACGHSLTVSLTTKGHVYTMGSTAYGQLGNPSAKGKIPARVEGDIVETFVEEIACGSNHVVVLTSKSEIYTWGKGLNGQLGHGTIENKTEPAVVGFLKEKQVKAITCGSNFTAVICVHKWIPGSEHSLCAGCRNPFNFRRKRHNCYNCGLVFCKVCSSRKSLRAALAPDVNKPYRVCYGCFTKLKKTREPSPSVPTPRIRNLLTIRKPTTDVSERDSLAPKLLSPHSRISSTDSLSHLGEGRHQRRDLKPEVNNSNVFPFMNGSLLPLGSPLAKGSTALPRITKNMMVKISGSRVSSRAASPVSVKSSPPRRSYEIADESKQIKDIPGQEMAGLKGQVEQLTSKTLQLEEELEKTRKQLKVVTAMAADEAEENRSAKEVIRSLSAQLKEMVEKESTSSNSKHRGKEKSGTQSQTSNQTHTRSMVPHDSQHESNLTSKSSGNGHRKHHEKPERVVQDEPGVYLTLLTLPGGGHELKRVRFSRKQFTEEQAEKWWGENGSKVCERHNILVS